MPGKGTELHSVTAIRQWFYPKANEVPAEKLLASFEKTQKAVDAMLERLEAQEKHGFRLGRVRSQPRHFRRGYDWIRDRNS